MHFAKVALVRHSIALMPYRPFLDGDEPILIGDANVLFTGKVQDKLEKQLPAGDVRLYRQKGAR